jgi:hypothetical protein
VTAESEEALSDPLAELYERCGEIAIRRQEPAG